MKTESLSKIFSEIEKDIEKIRKDFRGFKIRRAENLKQTHLNNFLKREYVDLLDRITIKEYIAVMRPNFRQDRKKQKQIYLDDYIK